MKLTKILATALVSLFAMSAAVSAADPACVMDFTNPDYTAAWVAAGAHNVEVSYDEAEKAMRLASTAGDPYTEAYTLTADEQFDQGANTWMKISYKVIESDGGKAQFHWGNTGIQSGPHAETNFNWDRIGEEGEWVEQVVEIIPTGGRDDAWTTTLTKLRIDPFHEEQDGSDADGVMFVKYIAFFASEADANAWTFGAAAADPAPEAPATSETAPAPEAGAAQTADMFSVAIAALACAAAAGAVVCSKKR